MPEVTPQQHALFEEQGHVVIGPILPPAGGAPTQTDEAVKRTLLGRLGTVEEVGAAALFLLGARYLTGVVLCVDGGRSLVAPA